MNINGKEIIHQFQFMRDFAELKALSKVSLERTLTDREFNRMMQLKKEVLE